MRKQRVDEIYLPAAEEALRRFPLEVDQVTPVSLSENLTFRVTVKDEKSDYVLRLHRPDYNSLAELESERLWTASLAETGIAVPGSLATGDGEQFTLVSIPDADEERYAGVTTWTTGTVLRDYLKGERTTAERAGFFHWIGEMVARMHNHSVDWTPPPGFTRRRLDADALLGDRPTWGRFWNHEALSDRERAQLLRKRDELRQTLDAYGEDDRRWSLIHADVDPGNLIHHEGRLALIDFDDAGFGWHLYDLATTLDEFMIDDDVDALQDALVQGYRKRRMLREEDLKMLPTFRLIRGMALMGWYHQRPEHRGDPYFDEVKSWVLIQCNNIEIENY